jgi:hypothetical protein
MPKNMCFEVVVRGLNLMAVRSFQIYKIALGPINYSFYLFNTRNNNHIFKKVDHVHHIWE